MIALVPARGGSKGFKRKNLALLAGKPLIIHSLECAIAVPGITRVVVSTDDPEIAAVARSVAGVETPFLRPKELATDEASAIDVYLHAANTLGKHGSTLEELCVLLPTSPLRIPSDVENCISLFEARSPNVVVSVSKAKPANWHQILKPDGLLVGLEEVKQSVANRQAFQPEVVPNGSIYVFKVNAIREKRTYFSDNTIGYEMPASRSIDIDTEDDLAIATALISQRAVS